MHRMHTVERQEMKQEGQSDFLDMKHWSGVPAVHVLSQVQPQDWEGPVLTQMMSRKFRAVSLRSNHRWQWGGWVTKFFQLLLSWTAAISLYREQGVMDMAFMSELLLTFLPSPPSFNCNRRKSLPLLFKYSHYGFGSSCHSKEPPVISAWEEYSASKSH